MVLQLRILGDAVGGVRVEDRPCCGLGLCTIGKGILGDIERGGLPEKCLPFATTDVVPNPPDDTRRR